MRNRSDHCTRPFTLLIRCMHFPTLWALFFVVGVLTRMEKQNEEGYGDMSGLTPGLIIQSRVCVALGGGGKCG